MTDHHEARGPQREVRIAGVVPILRVSDFDRSVAYYREALGFELQWQDGRFGSVARGGTSLMLSEGSQGCSSTWLWIGVSDADALHEELRARGAIIRHPPTNYPWGSREVHVFDADRHVLRFGAESRPGKPLGEWLDESGVRWLPNTDGSWTRAE